MPRMARRARRVAGAPGRQRRGQGPGIGAAQRPAGAARRSRWRAAPRSSAGSARRRHAPARRACPPRRQRLQRRRRCGPRAAAAAAAPPAAAAAAAGRRRGGRAGRRHWCRRSRRSSPRSPAPRARPRAAAPAPPGRGVRARRSRSAGLGVPECSEAGICPLLQHQHGLQQAGDAGGRLEVADVGLDRADRQRRRARCRPMAAPIAPASSRVADLRCRCHAPRSSRSRSRRHARPPPAPARSSAACAALAGQRQADGAADGVDAGAPG